MLSNSQLSNFTMSEKWEVYTFYVKFPTIYQKLRRELWVKIEKSFGKLRFKKEKLRIEILGLCFGDLL